MEKHLTAGVFILTREVPRRVLLLLHNKFGKWMPPGGHVEQHENPYEAAIREVKEETGLDISAYLLGPSPIDEMAKVLPLPFKILEELVPEHGDKPEHCHIDHIYVVFIPFQEAAFDAAESSDIRWVTEGEMEGLETFNDCRMMMREIF